MFVDNDGNLCGLYTGTVIENARASILLINQFTVKPDFRRKLLWISYRANWAVVRIDRTISLATVTFSPCEAQSWH